MSLSLETARTERTAGVVLTIFGLAASIGGAVALAGNVQGRYPGAPARDLGIAGLAVGAVGFGAGVGLWGHGDLEVRRAEGRAPMLTPERRRERGHSFKHVGVAMMVLGGMMAVSTLVTLGTCIAGVSDSCDIDTVLLRTAPILAGVGSTFLGLGVPLLAVGLSEEHKGARLILDSVAPRAMAGGGGLGFSGRF